jgi:DUF1680 family protein
MAIGPVARGRVLIFNALWVIFIISANGCFGKEFQHMVKGGNHSSGSSPTRNKTGLLPQTFEPLPLGSIRPAGWLLTQLRIQANGLTGHLDEFWPDVMDSGWIGGKAEGWERAPYWLDGLVPLAFLLDDERLKAKARRWMDYILTHQSDDGWLGPIQASQVCGGSSPPCDPWPVFIILKAMTQYFEATRDDRVVAAMQKCLRRMSTLLAEHKLEEWGDPGLSSWAAMRYGDLLVSIYWLYDLTGEEWLLDLAATAHRQGFDWRKHFADFQYTRKIRPEELRLWTHVVNNAMATKMPGVWYRQSKDPADREAVYQFIATLDRYHGQVTGLFTGDEHYAGRNPSQGTETCAVVEYLFSLETLTAILGDAKIADRLERMAFNALPAPFTPDMWARQYDQQANQVQCARVENPIWTVNPPEAGLFGVATSYGCCTANMHQGWPKFASHLWMRTKDAGFVAITYAPCVIRSEVAKVPVQIEVATEYPFDDVVRLFVRAYRPVRFPIELRIPSWAEGAEVTFADERPVKARAGDFHRVEREWAQGETRLTLRLPMPVRVERGYHNSAAIVRGPLIYSLRVGEDWRRIEGEPPRVDWEVYPTTPWNYALALDPEHPEKSIQFSRKPIGACPFSSEGAPVTAAAKGRRVPAWTLEQGAAGPLPESPVRSSEPLQDLVLVPYGCAKLRVTEFPVLK